MALECILCWAPCFCVQAMHGNPNYMMTYGNGKGAGRVQDGLRSNGAHRFNIPHKKYK